MGSKLYILVWEQARNSFKALLFLAGTLLVYAGLLYFVFDLIHHIFARSTSITMGVAYLPLLGATAILFLNENRNVVRFDYPRRMFIWPINTGPLVSVQLVYKVAMLSLLCLASGMICKFLIYEPFIWWPPLVAGVVWIVALQALVLLIMAFGAGTGVALAIAVGVVTSPAIRVLAGAVSLSFREQDPAEPLQRPDWAITCGSALALTVAWWIVVVLAAKRARSEMPADRVGLFVRLLASVAHFEGPAHDFKSKEAAQRWYEWRRGPFLYPWIAVAAGFLLHFVMGSAAQGMHERFQFLLIMLGLAPAVVACLVGYSLTRNDATYTWFVGARPIGIRAISAARLAASLRAMGIGYALLIAAFVAGYWFYYPDSPLHPTLVQDLRDTTTTTGPYAEGLAMFGGLLVATVLAVWSIFWLGRIAGAAIWIAGFAAAIAYARAGTIYDMGDGSNVNSPVITVFLYALTAVAVAGLIGAYIEACRRRFLTPAHVAVALATGCVLAGSAYMAHDYLPAGLAWIIALWMLIPLLPFAALPLTIDFQRHG